MVHSKRMRKFGRRIVSLVLLLLMGLYCVSAQTGSPPPVTTVFAILVKPVEVKTAALNQELSLRTISDVLIDGRVVIPRGSSVLGHVEEFAIKGNGNQKSFLAVVIDKALIDASRGIPLQAIIAAVAAPQNDGLSSDPTYGMMHSNEPKMVGSPGGSARGSELSASSKVSSTAAIATANINGAPYEGLMLTEDSQGAVGFTNDLSLSWRLTAPPAVTIFSSKEKNLKLEAGTQVLLRMAPPSSAR